MVSTTPYSLKAACWEPASTVGTLGRAYIPRTAKGVRRIQLLGSSPWVSQLSHPLNDVLQPDCTFYLSIFKVSLCTINFWLFYKMLHCPEVHWYIGFSSLKLPPSCECQNPMFSWSAEPVGQMVSYFHWAIVFELSSSMCRCSGHRKLIGTEDPADCH